MQTNQTEGDYTFWGNTVPWIEKLLHTPVDDYRKTAVNHCMMYNRMYNSNISGA
jgi:hypothetical protein